MNLVVIVGNVGKAPELQKVGTGEHRVCRFSVALNRNKRPTLWVNIEAWDQLADLFCQHVGQGQKVTIQGELDRNEWTDQKSGQKKSIDYVKARVIEWDQSSARRSSPQPEDEDQSMGGWGH